MLAHAGALLISHIAPVRRTLATRRTGILNNEMYVGKLIWNRLRYVKDPETGKRNSRINPENEWVIHDVHDLRIVSDDLWKAAKRRQRNVKKNTRPDLDDRPFWDRRRPRYLFSGLMRCGTCGGGFSKISNNLFGCSTARNKGTCDNRLHIRRDILEATIVDGLKSRLMDPALFKEFAEEFYREVNRLRSLEAAKLDGDRSELARIEDQLKRIVAAISDGASARALKDELARLEVRQDELMAKLRDASTPAPLIHPNMANLYRQKVADLHLALEHQSTKAEAFEIIRSLVDEIVLTPENGKLRIDLRGDLAAILSLTENNKKPATDIRGELEQFKVVAGARNHRELTLPPVAI